MGVELTTSNLRKLCRICLGDGDYNLWEHKVSWSNSTLNGVEAEGADLKDGNPQELTVREVLQMYNDWQHSILDLDNELQLICKICLDELQPHFTYHRRLEAANKQLKQLYEQAQEQEQAENKAIIIENVVYKNSCTTYPEIVQEPSEQKTPEPVEQIVHNERNTEDHLSARTTTTKYAQKRKFAKNPKFILTGGVAQLLAHATQGDTSYATTATILDDVAQFTQEHNPPQKRRRTEEDVDGDVPLLIVDEKIINDFYCQDDAAVDNAATSESKSIYEQEVVYDAVQEVMHEVPPDEILTVDEYTEIQYSDELENIEQDEQKQQEQEEERYKQDKEPQPQVEEVQQQLAEAYQNREDVIQKHQPVNIKEHTATKDKPLTSAMPYYNLISDESGRSIYVCKYCPQAFTAPCFLMTHVRNSHACKYCSKTFVKTPDLFAHIKEKHSEHKCTICGKELSSNGNLKAHMKRMHRLMDESIKSTITTKQSTNATMSGIRQSTKVFERPEDGVRDVVYIDESNQIFAAEYLD